MMILAEAAQSGEMFSPAIRNICFMMGLLVALMSVIGALHNLARPYGSGEDAAKMLLGGLLSGGFMAFAPQLINTLLSSSNGVFGGNGTSSSTSPSPSPSPTMESSAPPTPSPTATVAPEPSTPTDYSWIWITLAIIGCVIVAILAILFVVYVISKSLSARRERFAEKRDREKRWDEATTSLHEFETTYSQMICDPMTILTMPLIDDLDEPKVKSLYSKWDAVRENTCSRGASADSIRVYARSVDDLVRQWGKVVGYARKIGLSKVSDRARAEMRKAEKMLAIALDESATLPERQSALDRVRAILDDLDLGHGPQRGKKMDVLGEVSGVLEQVKLKAITA